MMTSPVGPRDFADTPDFCDEDTDVAPNPAEIHERHQRMAGEPETELAWYEEDGLGMVLRVVPITH